MITRIMYPSFSNVSGGEEGSLWRTPRTDGDRYVAGAGIG
jgi:hypothetical protein